jgi:hypothetical protein
MAQAVSPWFPTEAARVRARVCSSGIVVDKVELGHVFPSTSVSPANLPSTKVSIIITTWGRYNRPISGRRAEWNQLDSTPHNANLKEKGEEKYGRNIRGRTSNNILIKIRRMIFSL